MLGILPPLSQRYVESHVNQVDVMAYYLEISSMEVQECIAFNRTICNPLRIDKNPTAGFYYTTNGKLRFNDFAGYFSGDIYDLVGYRTFLDPRNPAEFMQILHRICKDFGLWYYSKEQLVLGKGMTINVPEIKPKIRAVFDVQPREWTKQDEYYWKKFNISIDILAYFDVVPVYSLFINNSLAYNYSLTDPAYGYYQGKIDDVEQWRIYFPYRDKGKTRFYANTNRLQGLQRLQKTDIGVLTKSLKDVMCLYSYGVGSVGVPAESVVPNEHERKYLDGKWNKKFSLFDFDYAGITLACKMKRYGYKHLFLSTGKYNTINFQAKDISDFRYEHGDYNTRKLIELTIESEGTMSDDLFHFLNKIL